MLRETPVALTEVEFCVLAELRVVTVLPDDVLFEAELTVAVLEGVEFTLTALPALPEVV